MSDSQKLIYVDRSYAQQMLSIPYPINLFRLGGQRLVEWNAEGKESPVNSDYLERLRLNNKSERLFSVIEDSLQNPLLEPALFIFHVSRCGSTLAANYFATDLENRVFNEPMLFANLLEGSIEDESNVDLKQLINVFSLGKLDRQKRLVIKLSSRQLCHAEWFHKVLPNVPKCLIIREPGEVIISNIDNPPYHLTQAGEETKRDIEDLALESLNESYELAVTNSHLFDQIIDYSALKSQLPQLEARLWQAGNDKERAKRVALISRNSSKNPERQYVNDSTVKQEKWRSLSSVKDPRYQKIAKHYKRLFEKIS